MAPVNGSLVTIGLGHLEALMRRANMTPDSLDGTAVTQARPNATILVSLAEYTKLQHTAQKYANLRQNLIRGGVVEETVDILSRDNESSLDSGVQDGRQPADPPPMGTPSSNHAASNKVGHSGSVSKERSSSWGSGGGSASVGRPGRGSNTSQGHSLTSSQSSFAQHRRVHTSQSQATSPELDDADAILDADDVDDDGSSPGAAGSQAQSQGGNGNTYAVAIGGARQMLERTCRRTLQLVNLHESTTHADLFSVIRGGMVLDVFLRTHDRSASVSFLHEADARAFFDHVRKHDLYIKSKRVDIRWSDRHFTLPGHVANKISIGATRNLVIQQVDRGRTTEESIREDLEHIHNLVVVSVQLIDSSCYISTNSVHNALVARTCMMSRLKYKRSKIEWFADACAQPLSVPFVKHEKKRPTPAVSASKKAKSAMSTVANRFQLLNVDEGDDDKESQGDTDADEGTSEISGGGVAFASPFYPARTQAPVAMVA